MKKKLVIALTLCMLLSLAGCDAPAAESLSPSDSATPEASISASQQTAAPEIAEAPVELTIAAAASLTDVMTEIVQSYKTESPNVTLTVTYGASGALQTQIEQGAPVDVFISAAQKQMDALDDQNLLLAGSRINLLENKAVLIVPNDSELGLKSFDDLAKENVKTVAMGDPASVPAGQYAEELLTNLGIKDVVEAKANLGTDVRQVLTWVESGEVDAGIVYATDAATSDKVAVVCEAPSGSVKKIVYPVAILKTSAYAEQAQHFIDFLKTDECIKLFEKYGFIMAE